VAREAGVSVATVSRVLNGSAHVSEATDRQVRTVANRLNYWPNGAARSLITSRTSTLGVLLPDLHGEFFSEVIRGVDLAARRAGYHLLVSSSHAATEELVAALRTMRGRIDALIVMAPDLDAPELIRECAAGTPTVVLNPGQPVSGCHAISIDNLDGAQQVVRHLVELGHRRIATVTGPARNMDARQRLEGYRAALKAAGIAHSRDHEFQGDFTEPSGYQAGRAIIRLSPRPTAVFVGNDKMAVGVLGALSDGGLRVPEDIAVAGFDDIEMSQYLNPPLTTVHADAYMLGERAVERALAMANDGATAGGSPRHEILRTTLVVRGSCGARSAPSGESRVHRSAMITNERRSGRTDRRSSPRQ
jgi:LacI family transcriptional regulator